MRDKSQANYAIKHIKIKQKWKKKADLLPLKTLQIHSVLIKNSSVGRIWI